MAGKHEEHARFIEALGGYAKVSAAVNESTSEDIRKHSVRRWMYRGIPHRFRGTLMKIAAERGVPVPPNFLGV